MSNGTAFVTLGERLTGVTARRTVDERFQFERDWDRRFKEGQTR